MLRTIMLFLYIHFGILALMLFLEDRQLVEELELLKTEEFKNNFDMQQIFYKLGEIQVQYPLPRTLHKILNYIDHLGHECESCGSPKPKKVHKRDQSQQQPNITIENTHLWQQLHQFINSHGHLPQTIFLKNQKQLVPSIYTADVRGAYSLLSENALKNNENENIKNSESQYQQQQLKMNNQVVPWPENQQNQYDPPIKLDVTEITQDQVNRVVSQNRPQLEEWPKNGNIMFQQSVLPQNQNEQAPLSMLPNQNIMVSMDQFLGNQNEPNVDGDNNYDSHKVNQGEPSLKNMWGIVGQISAAIAVIQAYLLVEAWEQINLANDVIFESERQIAEISSNINLLFAATDHLLFLRNRWENRNLHFRERRRIMGQIRKKIYRMGFLQYQTGKVLTDKKIALTSGQNGKLLHQRQQITNGLINAILFILNAFQILFSGEILSGGVSLFQIAVVATYLALPIGNAALYFLVGEQILSLRDTESEIHQLDVTLGSIIVHFQDTEDWLEFTIGDPAVAYKRVGVNNNIPISGTFNAPGFNFSPFSFPQATTTAATTMAATTRTTVTPRATTPRATTPAATTPAAMTPSARSMMVMIRSTNMTSSNPTKWIGAPEIKGPPKIVAIDPPISSETFGFDVQSGKKFSISNPDGYDESPESDEWELFDSEEQRMEKINR